MNLCLEFVQELGRNIAEGVELINKLLSVNGFQIALGSGRIFRNKASALRDFKE